MSSEKRLRVSPIRVLLMDVKATRNMEWRGNSASLLASTHQTIISAEGADIVEFEVFCSTASGDGNEAGPFTIEAKFLYRIRRPEGSTNAELLELFAEIATPVRAEYGLLVAQLTKAMGHVPVLFSPE